MKKKLLITIVLLIASFTSFSQEKCNYCSGRGYIIEKEYKTCRNCGGTRERSWTITKTCPLCQGTEKIYDKNGNFVKYCYSCDNGKVTTKYTEICGECHGKGGYYVNVEKDCPQCGGSGKKYR